MGGGRGLTDRISDRRSSKISDRVSDRVSDKISDRVSDKVSDRVSDHMRDGASDGLGHGGSQETTKLQSGDTKIQDIPRTEISSGISPTSVSIGVQEKVITIDRDFIPETTTVRSGLMGDITFPKYDKNGKQVYREVPIDPITISIGADATISAPVDFQIQRDKDGNLRVGGGLGGNSLVSVGGGITLGNPAQGNVIRGADVNIDGGPFGIGGGVILDPKGKVIGGHYSGEILLLRVTNSFSTNGCMSIKLEIQSPTGVGSINVTIEKCPNDDKPKEPPKEPPQDPIKEPSPGGGFTPMGPQQNDPASDGWNVFCVGISTQRYHWDNGPIYEYNHNGQVRYSRSSSGSEIQQGDSYKTLAVSTNHNSSGSGVWQSSNYSYSDSEIYPIDRRNTQAQKLFVFTNEQFIKIIDTGISGSIQNELIFIDGKAKDIDAHLQKYNQYRYITMIWSKDAPYYPEGGGDALFIAPYDLKDQVEEISFCRRLWGENPVKDNGGGGGGGSNKKQNPPPSRGDKKMDDCCAINTRLLKKILRNQGDNDQKLSKIFPLKFKRVSCPKDPKDPTKQEEITINNFYDFIKYQSEILTALDIALDPRAYNLPEGKLMNPKYERPSEDGISKNSQPDKDRKGNQRELEIKKDIYIPSALEELRYTFNALKRLEYLLPYGELNDAQIAKHLIVPGAKKGENLSIFNLIHLQELLLQYLDKTLGDPTEEIYIKDIDPTKKGDQSYSFRALSMAGLQRELFKFILDSSGDVDQTREATIRTLRTVLANRVTSVQTAEMVTALFEDSGMLEEQAWIDLHLEGDPYAGHWDAGKGFSPSQKLESHEEKDIEELARATLSAFTAKVKVSRRSKKEKQDMRDLLRGLSQFIQRLVSEPIENLDKLIESAKFKIQTDMALMRSQVTKAASASRNRTRKKK